MPLAPFLKNSKGKRRKTGVKNIKGRNLFRHSFKTAFCTAALSVLNSSGIVEVVRIERSLRYSIRNVDQKIDETDFLWIAGDRMTGSLIRLLHRNKLTIQSASTTRTPSLN